MQEIERFIRNIFSAVFSRIRYDMTESVERKIMSGVNQQLDQLHKPKREDEANREDQENRK